MSDDGDFDESFAGDNAEDEEASDFSLSSDDAGAVEDDEDEVRYRLFP